MEIYNMPRHYRKPSEKKKAIKTYEKEMIQSSKPKKVSENNIFENYSKPKKDKEKSKKKINNKK